MISIINIEDKIKEIDKPWSPIELARVNDQVIRMALFDGEFHWHKHTDEDELFYVVKGRIIIQLKGQPDVTLNKGEMAVVPKCVLHCPKSSEPSYALMFESFKLKNKGD